jgi:hypothetical protein
MEPPWEWMHDTSDISSCRTMSVRPTARCLYPSSIPTTDRPEFTASITAALMALLMPGAGPPPTSIPNRPDLLPVVLIVMSPCLCRVNFRSFPSVNPSRPLSNPMPEAPVAMRPLDGPASERTFLVHHKHALSGLCAVEFFECFHRLIQPIAVSDELIQRRFGVDKETFYLDQLGFAERP